MIRAVFLVEQHIGHRTYAQNLRQFFPGNSGMNAAWFPITYEAQDALWQRLLLLPGGLRGSLAGRYQARHGLHSGSYDVAFFNTQVPAALAGGIVHKRPYVLATDITPLQYDQLGNVYAHRADGFSPLARYKHRVNAPFPTGSPPLVVMCERPQGRGYVRLGETADSPWPAPGGGPAEIAAHEFHYSRLENVAPGLRYAYRVLRGHGIDGSRDGIVHKNLLASYTHLRDAGGNHWTRRFVAHVRACRDLAAGRTAKC